MMQLSKRQKTIFAIIKKTGEISQPDILHEMIQQEIYTKDNLNNARSSLSQILTKLKAKELIRIVRCEDNPDRGGIQKNIWGVRQDG